ncbi:MAG: hypothetical protein HN712_13800 [Gemmatimonadetes bacterium]|nr:hypothetical protein [Gemmatimonadota bacterium]
MALIDIGSQKQLFKMWYTTYWYKVRREGDDIVVDERFDEYAAQRLCLATSNDGVHWEKPELGLVEFEGSKRNNILPETCLTPRDFGACRRLLAAAGSLGADALHGLGPHPPVLRRAHGEQPALSRPGGKARHRPGREHRLRRVD